MGLLSSLLLFPVTGPLRGIQFVIEQIQAEAEAMLFDEKRVQAQIMSLSLRLDQGEISEEEYEEHEAVLLEQLNAIIEYKESLLLEERYYLEDAVYYDVDTDNEEP
jgi:hypothetical protein